MLLRAILSKNKINIQLHLGMYMYHKIFGELIYTCKMIQPVDFSRFKPDNLLLSTARFAGYNLEKYTGWLNLQKKGRLDHFTGID